MVYEFSLDSIKNKFTKKYVIEAILLLLLFVLGYFLLGQFGLILQDPTVKEVIAHAGILTPLIFAFLYELSIVIAPIPGFPLVIMGFDIFGIWQMVVFNYLLSLLGGAINFYIARQWGRGVVRKLIGKGGLKRVDEHVDQFSTEMLILTRLFDGFLFEWVSYAAGLTTISFKRYMIITAICSIPYNLVALYFALRISDLGQLFASLSVVYYVTISLPFIYYITKRVLLHAQKRRHAHKVASV